MHHRRKLTLNGVGECPNAHTARVARRSGPARFARDVSRTEHRLWPHLRGSQTGAAFRRQHPVGPYFPDYFCASLKLAVEVYGPMYDAIRDSERDATLRELGVTMLRLDKTGCRFIVNRFILGFAVGCSWRFLLYAVPVLIFGLWRWPNTTWDLYLIIALFFLSVWAAFLLWKWIEYKRKLKAAGAEGETDPDPFKAGLRAAKRVM